MAKVRVWDLPTRLFHWSFAASVVGLVATGQIGGDAMVWHFRLGYAVLALLLFRIVWGFAGGYWSRFRAFVPTPGRLFDYLRTGNKGTQSVGHNPLGALSVLAILLVALVQVFAGLMSDDEVFAVGPLVGKVPAEWVPWTTFYHGEIGKLLVIGLVVLHVAAIAWYRFKKNQKLVTPMITGDKEMVGHHNPSRDDAVTRFFALGVLVLCGLAVAAMLRWAQ